MHMSISLIILLDAVLDLKADPVYTFEYMLESCNYSLLVLLNLTASRIQQTEQFSRIQQIYGLTKSIKFTFYRFEISDNRTIDCWKNNYLV